MTAPINNPQPDSYGDSVPYQGSMPYQSGGLYPGDGFYQGGVPYQNGGFYQGGGPYLGYPQTYVAQPQVSVPPRVDQISISCGIAGWVIIVLALLDHGAPQVLRALPEWLSVAWVRTYR